MPRSPPFRARVSGDLQNSPRSSSICCPQLAASKPLMLRLSSRLVPNVTEANVTAPSTWHVQINGKRDGLSDARRYARLCRHGDAGDVGPGGEGLGADRPEVCGGVAVSAAGENVGHLVMGGKEALNLPWRLEPLHDPLSSSGWLMCVFGPVIEALCSLLAATIDRMARATRQAH